MKGSEVQGSEVEGLLISDFGMRILESFALRDTCRGVRVSPWKQLLVCNAKLARRKAQRATLNLKFFYESSKRAKLYKIYVMTTASMQMGLYQFRLQGP